MSINKKEANWHLYYKLEDIIHKGSDIEIKKVLDQFNTYDFSQIPIIFELISYKKVLLLEFLYKKGIDLTYEDYDGGNALHIACGASGSLECVKFLIKNNILIDINKKSTQYGDTPLTLAISYEHQDILEYLKKKFRIESITIEELEVILDRLKSNYRRRFI
jgi:ankyrin repeat protein